MTIQELFEIKIYHGYILQLFLAEALFFPLLARREKFVLRLCLSFAVFALLSIVITNVIYHWLPSGLNSVTIFILSLGMGAACFKSSFKEVLFCFVGAQLLQNLSHNIENIVYLPFAEKISDIGTPAESLCGLQVEQFRKKYGIVEGVSDRPYVSNSFHCHVTEDITPIEKQDCEGRFWELCNGGKIQYVRYPIGYNVDAIRALVRRAMDLGYYEGVNLSLAYCDDCGHEELEMDVCPVCGSKNLTKIDRMNGYLSYSRVHGDTRLNTAKMAEIAERKSM